MGYRIRSPPPTPEAVEEPLLQPRGSAKACPKCGAKERLYRTPRGLRCADCVKLMDSAGLMFR